MLLELRRDETALILVTHDLEIVARAPRRARPGRPHRTGDRPARGRPRYAGAPLRPLTAPCAASPRRARPARVHDRVPRDRRGGRHRRRRAGVGGRGRRPPRRARAARGGRRRRVAPSDPEEIEALVALGAGAVRARGAGDRARGHGAPRRGRRRRRDPARGAEGGHGGLSPLRRARHRSRRGCAPARSRRTRRSRRRAPRAALHRRRRLDPRGRTALPDRGGACGRAGPRRLRDDPRPAPVPLVRGARAHGPRGLREPREHRRLVALESERPKAAAARHRRRPGGSDRRPTCPTSPSRGRAPA